MTEILARCWKQYKFIVQIYKMTSDKIDYSKLEKDKDKENKDDGAEDMAEA